MDVYFKDIEIEARHTWIYSYGTNGRFIKKVHTSDKCLECISTIWSA